MGTYKTSSEKRVKKSTIDHKIRIAKQNVVLKQIEQFGYNFCIECDSTKFLDCSHRISVDKCQKEGRSELAWDEDNIDILCRECHRKRDKLNLQFKNI